MCILLCSCSCGVTVLSDECCRDKVQLSCSKTEWILSTTVFLFNRAPSSTRFKAELNTELNTEHL